jgi:hypothetical protein
MSREHARPQPQPAAAGTGERGRGAGRLAPVSPVGVTAGSPATRNQTQRPRGQVGAPAGGAHPAHLSSPMPWTRPGGERWPILRAAGLADHPAAHGLDVMGGVLAVGAQVALFGVFMKAFCPLHLVIPVNQAKAQTGNCELQGNCACTARGFLAAGGTSNSCSTICAAISLHNLPLLHDCSLMTYSLNR